jgi:acetoin utilization deacetylase AcuC-like enzyme
MDRRIEANAEARPFARASVVFHNLAWNCCYLIFRVEADSKGCISPVGGDPGRLRNFRAASIANERPDRILYATEVLTTDLKDAKGLARYCLSMHSRSATREELMLAHSVQHVDLILALEGAPALDVIRASTNFNYVFMNSSSVTAARVACASAIDAVNAVMRGLINSALCVVRPPGHHSEDGCAMGFCLFNSVAVAAKAALASQLAQRVLIVDWDIHHGNGSS